MFDNIVFDMIDSIYAKIDEHKESNKEIIDVLISLHMYINKQDCKTKVQYNNKLLNMTNIIYNKVEQIIKSGIDKAY